MESEEAGKQYLQQKEEEEKNKLTWDDIREIYRTYKDEIQQFFSYADKYNTRINQLKWEEQEIFDWFPKSFRWLIPLLWWDISCHNWWYVIALLESEEAGKQYLQQKEEEEKNKLTWDDIREIYRTYKDGIQQFFSNASKYKTRISQLKWEEKEIFDWFPKSFQWLVPLLWWDKTCTEWWYVIALLESEEAGKQYLQQKEEEEKNKLTWDDIREIYRTYKDKIQQFFSYPNKYNIRINQLKWEEKEIFDWFPKTFGSLISLLWWDKTCTEWWYVIALLESEEAGKQYLQDRKKRKFNS